MKTVELDTDALLDMVFDKGLTNREIAEEFGNVSVSTVSKRIADIQKNQGLLMQYRAVQSLQLTALQAKILENITDEKIQEAPLRDLIVSYKILKDKELVVDGKPNEIKGLVGYLVEMEKQQIALNDAIEVKEGDDFVDEGGSDLNNPDYIPEL